MDNELIEEIHIMKNHSERTERIYKHAVKKYTEFCGMSLKELLDEADANGMTYQEFLDYVSEQTDKTYDELVDKSFEFFPI